MKIALSAGEESGDILGSDLMRSLKAHDDKIEFIGIGGERMKQDGLESLFPINEISKMGIIEPLLSLKTILKRRKQLISFFESQKPDIFIGIDSPSFNLGISKKLKKKIDISTIQYVCPQFWAWREDRIKSFSKFLDHIFCLYDFEKKILRQHNINSSFVGHPIAEKIEFEINRKEYKQKLNLDENSKYVVLMPGSRKSEVTRHFNVLASLSNHYLKLNSKLRFIFALTEDSKKLNLEKEIKGNSNLEIHYGNSRNILRACDYAVITSGTASLEAALCKIPMIVIYKTNFLSYMILSRLIKTEFISLPNILKKKKIVEELIQTKVTKKNLVSELEALMNKDHHDLLNDYKKIHSSLINSKKTKFYDVINSIKKIEKVFSRS